MNKNELTDKIAASAGINRTEAKKALDAAITAIKDTLATGDKVVLADLGTFSVKERAERVGRNPLTKEKITIPAKRMVCFKGARSLNGRL